MNDTGDILEVTRRAIVRGRVQGVAFRWHARSEARRLDLAGWVRNLLDGRVEAVFRGTARETAAFETWLRHGPSLARVDGLEVFDAREEELERPFTIT